MKFEKIDFDRLGDDHIVDDGGIKEAMRKIYKPVYEVRRHGVHKRYLSRSAAVDNLAQIMATHVYKTLGKNIREPGRYDNENYSWTRGELTFEYRCCRNRAKRRILRLLAKIREIEAWDKEHQKWVEKREELYSRKPY